ARRDRRQDGGGLLHARRARARPGRAGQAERARPVTAPGSPGPAELAAAIGYLKSPLAIRARAENVLSVGLVGGLEHFTIDLARLAAVADRVAAVTRAAYPTLDIPVHGRMNHFKAGGIDRVAWIDADLRALPREEQARAWVDLVTVSVLLDAGAGDRWRFRE